MANTYIITSVNELGDLLTTVGTVNGIPVIVQSSVAAAGNALASALGFQNYIAPLMLAAVPPTSTNMPGLTGTFVK